jgi:large subunit ribosomal protein L25
VVDQVLQALLITAKPADIPSGLTVDITDLEIGDAKRVSDIVLPEGVTTSVDLEDPVVTASHGVSEAELEAAEAEVAGETGEEAEAEGEAAEGGETEASGDEASGDAAEGGDEG